ncbi:MAG: hydroxymethylbilane synthase [Sulfuricella sp.]|nr:hydroxymethylbilane synthase [Sulfuricella sp.]
MKTYSDKTDAGITQITIATRESALAMWQAHHIRQQLQALYPQIEIKILGMTTTGDQILDKTLSKIGGKGLFVKELEQAMQEGRADIAVHSLKDVPMVMPEGFVLAAIGEREDPRDAFVSNQFKKLEDLPPGSVVGTSSLRRQCQIQARLPTLKIESLRGNVQTRLRKLDEGRYAAIILAAAGLKRLGLGERITSLLPTEQSLPAVGQGAIGIECRAGRDDLIALLAPLNHPDTAACVTAERAMSRALAGSCQVPLGGFAEIADGVLRLRGFVSSVDGVRVVRSEVSGQPDEAERIGAELAQVLIGMGADKILAELEAQG